MLLGCALLALGVGGARAATQAILGVRFDVRTKRPGDPTSTTVALFAQEEPTSPNTLVGDPSVGGATLRLVTRGTSTYDQTFSLPARGWKVYFTRHDWPVWKVLAYSNATIGGPVRSLVIRRGGYASVEGTPPPDDPRPEEFRIKLRMTGRDGAIDVVPPNPGTESGILIAIGGGDTYCVAFGGVAGGTITSNVERRFTVGRPVAEGCPVEP